MNLFFDAQDEFHLSDLGYGFIAGQLLHARACSCACTDREFLQTVGARLRGPSLCGMGAAQQVCANSDTTVYDAGGKARFAQSSAALTLLQIHTWHLL